MSGRTMNYKAYHEYLKTMPEPIQPSELPKRPINLSAIAKYAKEHSLCIAALSDAEKERLIETVGKF